MSERGGIGAVLNGRRQQVIAGACVAVAVLGIAGGVVFGPLRGGGSTSRAAISHVGARVFDATTGAPAPTSDPTPDATVAPTSAPATDAPGLAGGPATATPGPVPVAALNPTQMDFGAVNVGDSDGAHFIALSNPGGPPLHVKGISTNSASFQLYEGQCGIGETLLPGQSCVIGVRFKPAAEGPLAGSVTVTDDASPPVQTARLTGTGTVAGASIDTTNIAFSGSSTGPVTVTVKSTGSGYLNILDIFVSGPTPDFAISANTCINGHPPGTQCTFLVSATPQAGASAYQATLMIYDDAPGEPQSIALSWAPGATTTTTTTTSTTT